MNKRSIAGTKKKVVVVDDNRSAGMALRMLAERVGFWSEFFDDPREALVSITSGSPTDLLVSDYTMPGMLGTDLAGGGRDRSSSRVVKSPILVRRLANASV